MNTIEILLVEDNIDDANLVIRALRKNNLANQLFHVKDGAEALDFVYGQGEYAGRNMMERPKVILLDLKMPKVGGIEVLTRLKNDPATKEIPIVILTSSKEDPDIKICYTLGANCYIVKPVEFDDFYSTIKQLGIFWLMINQPIPR